MVKAGVCKTPIGGSNPPVASKSTICGPDDLGAANVFVAMGQMLNVERGERGEGNIYAGVAELADATDLKSVVS